VLIVLGKTEKGDQISRSFDTVINFSAPSVLAIQGAVTFLIDFVSCDRRVGDVEEVSSVVLVDATRCVGYGKFPGSLLVVTGFSPTAWAC
jgi:hypothetical protein